jgi:hypothetical protein
MPLPSINANDCCILPLPVKMGTPPNRALCHAESAGSAVLDWANLTIVYNTKVQGQGRAMGQQCEREQPHTVQRMGPSSASRCSFHCRLRRQHQLPARRQRGASYRLSVVPLGRLPLNRCLGLKSGMCLSASPFLAPRPSSHCALSAKGKGGWADDRRCGQ